MAGIPHPSPLSGASYSAVELLPDDSAALLLEQRKLPMVEEYVRIETVDDMARAIRDMVVRGAPAIGIAAAYGMVLAARAEVDLARAAALLQAARPTAVNLAWAVDRMWACERRLASRASRDRLERLAAEARAIHVEDVAANRRLGELGAARVPDGATILTHCNAGALATGGYGTALGVIRAARDAGKRVRVLADETRPYLQGARLTAWELSRDGIDVTVITDGAAASAFGSGEVGLAVVGSDRIARNGDVANKIGTYGVACLARAHDRPFFVAAPWSTVDLACDGAAAIPIEQRAATEITHFSGTQIVPSGAQVKNPSFDVTPAKLVTAIFTERGVVEPVEESALIALSR